MTTWRYRFAGVLFESVIQLPEWDAFAAADAKGAPDARILLEGDRDAAAADGEYSISIPSVGRYRIHGGERIVFAPTAEASAGEVRLFLLGSALAALCTQRGLLLLHASVVRLAGRTVALCGPRDRASPLSPQRSSTAVRRWFRRPGPIRNIWRTRHRLSSIPRMKLSPEALQALRWPADRFARVHPRDQVSRAAGADDPWSPVPLHAICVLE